MKFTVGMPRPGNGVRLCGTTEQPSGPAAPTGGQVDGTVSLHPIQCPECQGVGYELNNETGEEEWVCDTCRGSGEIEFGDKD